MLAARGDPGRQHRCGVGRVRCRSGTDTIELPAGEYGLTRTGASENANATGDLDVTGGNLTIRGAERARRRSTRTESTASWRCSPARRSARPRREVTGGRAPDGTPGADAADGADGVGPGAAGGSSVGGSGDPGPSGGGILNAGTLTPEEVTVSDNRAGDGGAGGGAGDGGNGAANGAGNGGGGGPAIGGVGGGGGAGGGISSSGALTVTDSTIRGNVAGDGGFSGVTGEGGAGGARASAPTVRVARVAPRSGASAAAVARAAGLPRQPR